jgi:hypothetical protein
MYLLKLSEGKMELSGIEIARNTPGVNTDYRNRRYKASHRHNAVRNSHTADKAAVHRI